MHQIQLSFDLGLEAVLYDPLLPLSMKCGFRLYKSAEILCNLRWWRILLIIILCLFSCCECPFWFCTLKLSPHFQNSRRTQSNETSSGIEEFIIRNWQLVKIHYKIIECLCNAHLVWQVDKREKRGGWLQVLINNETCYWDDGKQSSGKTSWKSQSVDSSMLLLL